MISMTKKQASRWTVILGVAALVALAAAVVLLVQVAGSQVLMPQ